MNSVCSFPITSFLGNEDTYGKRPVIMHIRYTKHTGPTMPEMQHRQIDITEVFIEITRWWWLSGQGLVYCFLSGLWWATLKPINFQKVQEVIKASKSLLFSLMHHTVPTSLYKRRRGGANWPTTFYDLLFSLFYSDINSNDWTKACLHPKPRSWPWRLESSIILMNVSILSKLHPTPGAYTHLTLQTN